MSHSRTSLKTRTQSRKRPKGENLETAAFPAGRKRIAGLCVLLAALTVAVYSPVFGHQFVLWDDHDYITANPNIRGGPGWNAIRWAFTSTYASNWHPLTWLSHALDYELFGLNPAGHHVESVLIHALNAVLLFLLLAWISRRVWPSLLVAALFALHPLNVESVAWAAERKTVLSTLFFLLTIGAYVRYVEKREWQRYVSVAVLFAAGLMAKPMVITLPFVLLLLDYWPLDRMTGVGSSAGPKTFFKLLAEKIPLFALAAASAWITLRAQRGAVHTMDYPFALRAENAVVAYATYLWKMIWPARLAVLYPHSTIWLPQWQVLLSAAVLVGGTLLVYVFQRKRYVAVGWFWFLGTLVPVIGLVQVGEQALADRYAYIPLIGIFIMIAFGLDDWAGAKQIRPLWRVIPALCILTALSFVTVRQIVFWRSEYALWAHTVAITEQNPMAHVFLGAALRNPDVAMTAEDLEILDTEQARLDEARVNYEQAIGLYRKLVQQNPARYLPELAGTLADLANVNRREENYNEARQYFDEALQDYRQLERQKPGAYLPFLAIILDYLGSIDQTQNRIDEARMHYEEALHDYRRLDAQTPGKHQSEIVDIVTELESLEQFQMQMENTAPSSKKP
jgi:protein O-mannosyl-transferase